MKPTLILLCAFALFAAVAQADTVSNSAAYPLSTCIVSGKTLGAMGEPVVMKVGDREIRLCCNNCVATFNDDQEAWLAKIDAKIVEAQAASYPLETCVISGEKLGGMGDPVDHMVGNRLVRLCCPNCIAKVDADPAAAVAKLDAAVVAAQGPNYEATTCPVSGEELGGMGEPVNLVFNGELVKLCCSNCVAKFYADPVKAMAALHADDAEPAEPGKHVEDHSAHKH